MKNIKNIVESKYAPSKLNIWLKGDRLYIYTAKGWIPIDTSFGDVRKKEYADYDTLRFDKPTDGTIGVDKSTGKFYIYSNVTGTWTALDDEVIEGTYLADEDTFYTVDSDEVIQGERGKLYTDYSTGDIYRYHRGNWLKISSPVPETVFKVTWQELKDLRDNSKLIPGLKYRITDYQCTTTQENTQSAGHQFDIVLLALSENKLAEKGWAMMNESNVYDVTFSDAVTKKCWYNVNEQGVFLVDYYTHLAIDGPDESDFIVNETNKTIITDYSSDSLTEPDKFYNYFQNSNLPAWKVWYCLDNDKSRFAWATEDIDYIDVAGEKYYRCPEKDESVYYGWIKPVSQYNPTTLYYWTLSETPSAGDTVYGFDGEEMAADDVINSYTPVGKGVIYRLIDEWNNNIPYDFKNILIYNETYSQYCYAIIDNTENNFNEDPTLDGTKVKAIHVLCDNNDELKPIAKGGFGNNPLVNIIFLNNNTLADEYSNCIVSNGLPIVS